MLHKVREKAVRNGVSNEITREMTGLDKIMGVLERAVIAMVRAYEKDGRKKELL